MTGRASYPSLFGALTIGASISVPSYEKTWWLYSFDPDRPPATFGGDMQPFHQDYGADLAIVYVGSPVLQVHVVRPTLTPPVPDRGVDWLGGYYDVPLGMAGWSPNPDGQGALHRTMAKINWVYSFSGHGGEYWQHDNSHESVYYGDSGGALYVSNPVDGTRDLIGVISAFNESVSSFTDITRGAPRDWVRSIAVDTSRSAHWLAKHGVTEHWYGELDTNYWGTTCAAALDKDCDYWYDNHDNCPSTPNIDQTEGDDGWGTACPGGKGEPPIFGPLVPATGSHQCIETCYQAAGGARRCACSPPLGNGTPHLTGTQQ